ncbi:phosphatidylglycerophosphatase A [Parvibium lacunae]|uniref:Phosphatidylglycerophosphatase A n=1 Tax=Parvibium lacunae TaxID=1888893 RepID=A0A368L4N9_9BURK|nr:phosphatidylglycerophosphatase A [Parvibium lacunae]RCS58537.1 phosphatidylglycerophosphatase A [Parvibium lacunae]
MAAIRPTWRWICQHPARWLAFGAGAGLIRPAPGTWGTLLGWAVFVLIDPFLTTPHWFGLILAAFFCGIWLCRTTSHHLQVKDHGGIVWDEIVAIWLVLLFLPRDLMSQAWGFLAFRLFDILKPPPIRYYDQHWSGGLGVMWDDIVAAGYALLLLAVLQRFGLFA